MPPANGPESDRLEQITLDQVPTGKLYKLAEPLKVGDQNVVERGGCMFVADIAKLQIETRLLVESSSRMLQDGYYMIMEIRGVRSRVFAVLIPQGVPDEPVPGYGIKAEGDEPVRTEKKEDVKPGPITAEQVAPVSLKMRDLPKNEPLLLAATYSICMSGECGYLNKLPGDIKVTKGSMIEGMLLRSGQLVRIVEREGKLVLQKWCNENDEITIGRPSDELAVSIPNGPIPLQADVETSRTQSARSAGQTKTTATLPN